VKSKIVGKLFSCSILDKEWRGKPHAKSHTRNSQNSSILIPKYFSKVENKGFNVSQTRSISKITHISLGNGDGGD
jgi:hypothetical protein